MRDLRFRCLVAERLVVFASADGGRSKLCALFVRCDWGWVKGGKVYSSSCDLLRAFLLAIFVVVVVVGVLCRENFEF